MDEAEEAKQNGLKPADILEGNGDLDKSLLSESFEPLEDLDDAEYSLPAVEYTPTLEEILGGDDGQQDEDEDEEDEEDGEGNGPQKWNQDTSLGGGSFLQHESLSLASGGSAGSKSRSSRSTRLSAASGSRHHRRHQRRGGAGEEIHGTIMRHVILKGISSQVRSASSDHRVGAGLPTCLAASDLIAVGTAHGFVLVFDSSQALRWSLRCQDEATGPVSALDFSPDSSRLLVGFARGQVAEFEVVATGKMLQTLGEAHPPGSAVTHVRFTDDPSIALIADSGGSVFEIVFRKKLPGLRGYNSRCIFSGSRGEVCTVEPLSLVQHPGHFLTGQNIVALASISKILVLCLRPSMQVLFSHPLTGSPDTLPVLSWQFVLVRTSSRVKVVDPVLAFARQSTVYFYQVTESLDSARPAFMPLQRLDLAYDVLTLKWLNNRCMAVVDTEEGFHLHDIKNQEELETVDLSGVHMVYGSSFFKGLATGGNVSKAMSRAGERAVYNSVATFTDQLLILGRESFHILVIRTWSERLDHLVKANQHARALDMGREFLQDQGKTLLVGLHGPREKRRSAILAKVLKILEAHVDTCVTVNFPSEGGVRELADHYGAAVPPAVHACLAIKRKDVLFSKVWETFSLDPFAKAAFLEALEPYILSDQLRNVPVSVCQEFVKHYEAVDKLQALEACITHLNVTSLDIHQVMSLCRQHRMHEAVIYVYNNAMLDYVTPAEELLAQLRSALAGSSSRLSQAEVDTGNKLLVYVSCCLAGRAYPHVGDVPADRAAQVKSDVYACLTALHTKRAPEDEAPYPHLRTLLRFDCQGLLNVIELAFEEPEFRTDTGHCQKQRLVDILLQIMVRQGEEESEGEFSATQVGHLFTFLARRVAAGDKGLQVSKDLLDKVLDVLTGSAEGASRSHREERQHALLEMLGQGRGSIAEQFDRGRLLGRLKAAGFTRILERLHEDAGDFDLVLKSHLEDAEEENRLQAFAFARKVLASLEDEGNISKYEEEARGKVERSVVEEISSLAHLSPERTASLVCNHMRSYLKLVLVKLENGKDEELLYKFLRSAFDQRQQLQQSPVKSPGTSDDHGAADPLSSEETFERYLELMCTQELERVAPALRSSRGGTFDAERMLAVVRRHGNVEAEAHLLEREGRTEEAFSLLRAGLEKRLEEVVGREAEDLGWSRVEAEVIKLVQLLQRANRASSSPEDKQKMWFTLLDMLLDGQDRAGDDKAAANKMKEFVRHVVNSTLGHVPLRSGLERVLKHPAYQGDRVSFGEVRAFLTELLSMYHYEETLLRSTVRLVQGDLHQQVLSRNREARRGVQVPDPISCDLCQTHLALRGGLSVVFCCGHSYHARPCLSAAGCAGVTPLGEEQWQCYRCMTQDNRGVGQKQQASTEAAARDGGGRGPARRRRDDLSEDQLESIVNRRLVEAKSSTDALKTSESPLATLDRMGSGEFVRKEEFVPDEAKVSLFARQDFQLKLWPGLEAE